MKAAVLPLAIPLHPDYHELAGNARPPCFYCLFAAFTTGPAKLQLPLAVLRLLVERLWGYLHRAVFWTGQAATPEFARSCHKRLNHCPSRFDHSGTINSPGPPQAVALRRDFEKIQWSR